MIVNRHNQVMPNIGHFLPRLLHTRDQFLHNHNQDNSKNQKKNNGKKFDSYCKTYVKHQYLEHCYFWNINTLLLHQRHRSWIRDLNYHFFLHTYYFSFAKFLLLQVHGKVDYIPTTSLLGRLHINCFIIRQITYLQLHSQVT